MDLKLDTRPDHLRVVVTGAFERAAAREGLAQMVSQSQATGLTRILIDGRGIAGLVSIADRYELATSLAAMAGSKLRVAILVSPANMFTKTLEDTATNRGAQVRTTASLDEALAFLGIAGPG